MSGNSKDDSPLDHTMTHNTIYAPCINFIYKFHMKIFNIINAWSLLILFLFESQKFLMLRIWKEKTI